MPIENFHFWYQACNPDTLHRANKNSNLSQYEANRLDTVPEQQPGNKTSGCINKGQTQN